MYPTAGNDCSSMFDGFEVNFLPELKHLHAPVTTFWLTTSAIMV
jgi:hypothetical protein